MAVALRQRPRPRPTVPIAPMIDVVFLLLIYLVLNLLFLYFLQNHITKQFLFLHYFKK